MCLSKLTLREDVLFYYVNVIGTTTYILKQRKYDIPLNSVTLYNFSVFSYSAISFVYTYL